MWSRWVASVTRPSLSHSTHNGHRANNSARMRWSLRPVVRGVAFTGLAHGSR